MAYYPLKISRYQGQYRPSGRPTSTEYGGIYEPEEGTKGDTGINRISGFERELGDPAWRRWFDTLHKAGVGGLGDEAYGARTGKVETVPSSISTGTTPGSTYMGRPVVGSPVPPPSLAGILSRQYDFWQDYDRARRGLPQRTF